MFDVDVAIGVDDDDERNNVTKISDVICLHLISRRRHTYQKVNLNEERHNDINESNPVHCSLFTCIAHSSKPSRNMKIIIFSPAAYFSWVQVQNLSLKNIFQVPKEKNF